MENCQTHDSHAHQHAADCGHERIQVQGKEAFVHDGHLHSGHAGHWDETTIAVTAENPADCKPTPCDASHTAGTHVPHGDHQDVLIGGRLHHDHDGHCDDHGAVTVLKG